MEHPVVEYMKKKSHFVIGLMSGTSADGVDAALCKITGNGTDTQMELLGFFFKPYETDLRNEILRLATGQPATAADFCNMNFRLGLLYRDTALELCTKLGFKPEDVDLIGSHGQTFWHIPERESYFGESFRSTFQLGEGSVLAQAFHCPVISDFRVRDLAADGQGAPLVPYSEYLLYRSREKCIALQNIGGIGNVTCLLPDCKLEDVFAFDTGPGNMIMDAVIFELTNGKCRWDEEGKFAGTGTVHKELLNWLMEDEYIPKQPPKTTGREYYGPEFISRIMEFAKKENIQDADLMATVTAYTAETIAYSISHFFPNMPDRLIVGGGGSMNKTLLRYLKESLPNCEVMTNEDLGFDSNAKEAIAFAIMANEAMFASYNNVPSVTGAVCPVVMGKLSI